MNIETNRTKIFEWSNEDRNETNRTNKKRRFFDFVYISGGRPSRVADEPSTTTSSESSHRTNENDDTYEYENKNHEPEQKEEGKFKKLMKSLFE